MQRSQRPARTQALPGQRFGSGSGTERFGGAYGVRGVHLRCRSFRRGIRCGVVGSFVRFVCLGPERSEDHGLGVRGEQILACRVAGLCAHQQQRVALPVRSLGRIGQGPRRLNDIVESGEPFEAVVVASPEHGAANRQRQLPCVPEISIPVRDSATRQLGRLADECGRRLVPPPLRIGADSQGEVANGCPAERFGRDVGHRRAERGAHFGGQQQRHGKAQTVSQGIKATASTSISHRRLSNPDTTTPVEAGNGRPITRWRTSPTAR